MTEVGGEGEGEGEGPHRLLNPSSLPAPSGFSHVVVPAAGRTVYLGGQTGHGPDGALAGDSLLEQFDRAAANVVAALDAAGARPEHLVAVQIFVTGAQEYRQGLREIGAAWRRHFGRHYPAVSLFEVRGLFDPQAQIELVCVAVVPEG